MALEVLRLEGAVGDSDRREQRVECEPRKQPAGLFHPNSVANLHTAGPLSFLYPVRTRDSCSGCAASHVANDRGMLDNQLRKS